MRLSELLNPKAVNLKLAATTKREALVELVALLESAHGFKAGERACALPALSCGTCERCLSGLGVF